MTADNAKFNWKEEKIMICRYCNGTGKVEQRESIDVINNVKCENCNGTGRVVKLTTITYTPYEVG